MSLIPSQKLQPQYVMILPTQAVNIPGKEQVLILMIKIYLLIHLPWKPNPVLRKHVRSSGTPSCTALDPSLFGHWLLPLRSLKLHPFHEQTLTIFQIPVRWRDNKVSFWSLCNCEPQTVSSDHNSKTQSLAAWIFYSQRFIRTCP